MITTNDPAIIRCQEMFSKVLSSWASDFLRLRKAGLLTPGWRTPKQKGNTNVS